MEPDLKIEDVLALKWKEANLPCEVEDVGVVLNCVRSTCTYVVVLHTNPCTRCCYIICVKLIFMREGSWPRSFITNADVLRIGLACKILYLDWKESVWNIAVRTYGRERIDRYK